MGADQFCGGELYCHSTDNRGRYVKKRLVETPGFKFCETFNRLNLQFPFSSQLLHLSKDKIKNRLNSKTSLAKNLFLQDQKKVQLEQKTPYS